MTSFRTNLWCYPWDLVDEGVDEVLDRLKGEAGITGLSVAACYHSVDQYRPHPGKGSRRFRSFGGAQFQPDNSLYHATRMRPVVAEWLRKSNPLGSLAEACARRGLTLRAWVVCCHSSAAAGRYATSTVVDAFGQSNPAWLCPANPEVGEYLRAMIEDLSTHYGFEAIELERATFPTDLHTHAHEKVGVPFGPAGDWLRSLCFCGSCRQLAEREGVNATAAARTCATILQEVFDTGEPMASTVDGLLAECSDLAAFVEWRCRQVASLVKMLKGACACRLVVHRSGERLWAGNDFSLIGPHCDALLAVYYRAEMDGMADVVSSAKRETGSIEHVELGLSACTPPCGHAADLVAAMKRAAELGVHSVNVFNYGLIPLARLEWIRQASRYAQREAGT